MDVNNGALSFDSYISNADFNHSVDEMERRIISLSDTTVNESGRMDSSFKSLGLAIGTYFTFDALKDLATNILTVRGEFQRFQAVLENTLGSSERAETAMSMIKSFAASTPFQVDELTGSFVKLANQGFVPTYAQMTKLGDLASSTGKGFDQLAEAIIDAQTGEMERLKEFGIRASKENDKVTFTFKEQQKTVKNTSSAIREYLLSLGDMEGVTGANAKISATFEGKISNLHDRLTQIYNEIGEENEDAFGGVLDIAGSVLDNYKEIGEILIELTAVYGTYKAGLIACMAVEKASTIIKYESALAGKALTVSEALRSTGLKRLELVQAALNRTMLANPYVAMTAAVVGLGYGIYKLLTYETNLQKQQKKVNEAVSDFTAQVLQEERGLTNLFDATKRAGEGTEERRALIAKINEQYGKYLPSLLTEKSSLEDINTAYKTINTSLKEQIALKIKNTATEKIVTDSVQTQAEAILSMRKELISRVKNPGLADQILEEIKATTDDFQKAGSTWQKAWGQAYDNIQRKYTGKIKLGNAFAGDMEEYIRSVFDMESAINLVDKQFAPFIKHVQELSEDVKPKTEDDKPDAKKQAKLLKSMQKVGDELSKAQLQIEAGRIAIMDEGKQKRLSLLQQEYNETKAEINKWEKEQLSATGITSEQKKSVKDTATEQRAIAQQILLKETTKVEIECAKEIDAIEKDVTARFLSEYDARRQEINEYYNERIKEAKEAGEVETGDFIQFLNARRNAEREDLKKRKELSNIDYSENIDMSRLQLKDNGSYFVEEAEREKIEILKKYAVMRLEVLEQLSDDQSKKEAEFVKLSIEGYDKALAKPKVKSIGKIVDEKALVALQKHFMKLGDSEEVAEEKAVKFGESFTGKMQMAADIAGTLKESFGGMSEGLDMALDAVEGIAKGFAEGGLIGGINAAIGQAVNVATKLFTAKKEIDKDMLEGYENYMTAINDLIDTQIALLDKLGGAAFGENIQKTIEDLAKSMAASRTLLGEAMRAGSGLFSHSDGYKANKMLKGYKDQLRELGIYTNDLNGMTNEQLVSLKQIPEAYARLPEGIRKYIDDLSEATDKTEEFKQQVQDTVLGFDFSEISQAIIDTFTDPTIDDALGTFAGKVDAVLAKVVKNMLQRNLLIEPIQKMTEELYKSMAKKDANGNTSYELTADAAKKFKDGVMSLGANFQSAWKKLEEQFGSAGITLSPEDDKNKTDKEEDDRTATSKGIESISQESANEMVGSIRMLVIYSDKMSISVGKIDASILRALGFLDRIANNTDHLESIEKTIRSVDSGIKDLVDNGTFIRR